MFRVSLREIFLLVAATALAIVSLVYASQLWQAIVGLIAMLAAMIAVVRSLIDRGPHQAFAIGFAVGMVGYLLIVVNAQKFTSDPNSEMSGFGHLPTSLLLQSFYTGINRSGYVDAKTGRLVPTSETTTITSIPGTQALQTGAGRPIYYRDDPPFNNFMPIGHLWCAFIFGYVGGHFARFIYVRRNSEQVAAEKSAA